MHQKTCCLSQVNLGLVELTHLHHLQLADDETLGSSQKTGLDPGLGLGGNLRKAERRSAADLRLPALAVARGRGLRRSCLGEKRTAKIPEATSFWESLAKQLLKRAPLSEDRFASPAGGIVPSKALKAALKNCALT